MFFFWRTPDIQGFILLFGLAVLASFGHWLGIIALRYVDAAVCGNMEYTKIIFAAIIGFIFFQEIPDNPTFIGSGLIMSASLYMYYRERRRSAG